MHPPVFDLQAFTACFSNPILGIEPLVYFTQVVVFFLLYSNKCYNKKLKIKCFKTKKKLISRKQFKISTREKINILVDSLKKKTKKN